MKRHLWPAIGPILLSSALIFSTASIALVAGTMSVEAKILGSTHCYFRHLSSGKDAGGDRETHRRQGNRQSLVLRRLQS